MKKLLFIGLFVLSVLPANGQKVALKHNLAGDVLLSPNLALEVRLGGKATLDIYGSYNHFTLNDGKVMWTFSGEGKMMRHWMVQPEFRLWTCEAFNGTFFGLHGYAGQHNIFGMMIPPFNLGEYAGIKPEFRYAGSFYGGGLSVGYQWVLGRRWSIEASVGAGVTYMVHDVYDKADITTVLERKSMTMFWISKATLSVVFFIR